MFVTFQPPRISLLFIATIATLFATTPVRADWYYPLVRITCIPEASYAAVETFGLYNIGGAVTPDIIGDAVTPVPAALATQGIHELYSLADKPVTCELPQGKLLIEVVDYHAPQAEGYCGGVQDAGMKVSLAGSQVVLIKGTHGGCIGSQRHDIRVSQYEIQHCILRFEQATQTVESMDFTAVATKCKSVPLR